MLCIVLDKLWKLKVKIMQYSPFRKKILLDIKATEELVTKVLQFAHEMECSLQVEQRQNNSHAD